MKLNVAEKVKAKAVYTHEGAKAANITAEQELRRAVTSCLLWEDTFYESGMDIAKRISDLIPNCRPEFVAAVAFEARTTMKLRHAPLLVINEMSKYPGHKALVGNLLRDCIQRADELTEFLAIYWKEGKHPLSGQVKKGLARAFQKFDEYGFAKYNRDGPVRLRDALFLSHAKPTVEQVKDSSTGVFIDRKYANGGTGHLARHEDCLFEKIATGTLATPDTWEVALSAGADKRATFERLMIEGKLHALAFLRNLRNMNLAGVNRNIVALYGEGVDFGRVLPFRFISAANAVPIWEDMIEEWMLKGLATMEKLPGRTALLIDGSGSMSAKVSEKSDISRRDAAIALAILLRELCNELRIVGFSSKPWDIPPRRGFALRAAVNERVVAESTYLGRAVRHIQADQAPFDRVIVITDEQSADEPPAPQGTGYVINVAPYKNGIGYGPWVHVDGWSEGILAYIREVERVHP